MICVVGARRIRRSSPAPDVAVVDLHLLVATLTALPAVAAPVDVAAAYDRLRRASSWTSRPPVPTAAPWVAEYARALATEERLVRRGRLPTTKTASPPPRRRPRRRRRWFDLVAALLVLAAMFAMLFTYPILLQAVRERLVDDIPPAPTPVAGTSCNAKGEVVIVDGARLTCRPAKGNADLRWAPTG